MKKQQTVWVRNNGAEAHRDRYDGEDFEVAPGQSVEMTLECATLCLGFGDEDKSRCLRRLGWAATHQGQDEGKKRLAAFSFHMSESEANAHDPQQPSRSAAPAGGGDAPADTRKSVAGAAASAKPKGPLEKLAAAQAG